MKNIFSQTDCQELKQRIDKLNINSKAQWGKMNIAQALAHCNVTYEMIFEDKHKKPNNLIKLILTLFVKKKVVNEKIYPKNSPTAPQFIIKDDKDFNVEKTRLINYINQVQAMGAAAFEGKESHSFGILSSQEWNNMMYKHLDHHLTQFGA